MFRFIRQWRNQRIIRRSPITEEQWQQAFANLPILAGLTSEENASLRALAILFLHDKSLEGARGFIVTLPIALIIALQACLPILKLGLECYRGWYSVIVYRSGFSRPRVRMDEIGLEHHEQSQLAGESWQRGPVILAWDETEQAGIIDGHNLVIHEFAHKLDMQNGVANGFPPLHADMKHDDWVQAFTSGYQEFELRCQHGIFMDIDCYAASSPAEFFAVLSEVFFERPRILTQYYPEIYQQLRLYYRQDPLTRL